MARRAFAPAAVALLGWSMCVLHLSTALAQGTASPTLGSGLRIGSADAFPSGGVALPGRYDWLGTGLTSERQQSSVALPGNGALGLSIDQMGRHAQGTGSLHDAPTQATAMRLEASYLLGAAWGFASRYEAGSASEHVSSLQTYNPRWESLGVSLFHTGNLLRGDRLSLTLSGPVRTGMGDLLNDATNQSAQGDAFMGLRPGGREYATELSYFTPLSRGVGVGFAVSQRSGSLQNYGNPDERMMSIRFSSQF